MAADVLREQFTQISNAALRDARLSFKARGLLTWLASHEDGFGCSVAAIVAATKEGRDAVSAGLKELERYGYLTRTQERDPETGRLLPADYQVTDMPTEESPLTENPFTGSTRENAAKPQVGTVDGFSVNGKSAPKNTTSKNTTKNTTPSLPPKLSLVVPADSREGKGSEVSGPGVDVMLSAARADDRLEVVGPALRRFALLVDALVEGGWEPGAIQSHLTSALPEKISKPVGFIASRLSALPSSPPVIDHEDRPAEATLNTEVSRAPWCGDCDETGRM
ncbi:MAG: helix-turn-helix domain-containing protein, partial [Pseudonocardiaceae bacterium]